MPPYFPTIVSHRGLCDELPLVENSQEAFIAAASAGFPAECDVWTSSDGEPVVIHDATLDRTSFGTGPVSAHSSSELRKIRLRTPDGSEATVPMLRDVASHVAYIEVKPADAPELVTKVIRIMAGRKWKLLSFDPANLRNAGRIDPSIPVVLLVNELRNLETAIANKWPIYLEHSLLTDSIASGIRDAGSSIGVWTVDREKDLRRILPMRPDVIISNMPRMIQKLIRQ
jgi:glycerophosphoryl diester phosphodiesterase